MPKSNAQISLFVPEPPYVAERHNRPNTDFDSALAERYKLEAIAAAASSLAHQELLDILRPVLVTIARSRESRCVTADDAQAYLVERGLSPGALGNAAGSLFRGDEWKLVGYRPSDRVSRHRNRVGVWRLKDGK
jgi:hypothetical protein